MKKILHILSQRPEKTGSCIYLQSLLKISNQKNEIAKLYGIEKDKIITIGAGYDSDIFYENKMKNKEERIKLVYMVKEVVRN